MLFSYKAKHQTGKINIEYYAKEGSLEIQGPIEELVNQTHINGDGFLISVLSVRED